MFPHYRGLQEPARVPSMGDPVLGDPIRAGPEALAESTSSCVDVTVGAMRPPWGIVALTLLLISCLGEGKDAGGGSSGANVSEGESSNASSEAREVDCESFEGRWTATETFDGTECDFEIEEGETEYDVSQDGCDITLVFSDDYDEPLTGTASGSTVEVAGVIREDGELVPVSGEVTISGDALRAELTGELSGCTVFVSSVARPWEACVNPSTCSDSSDCCAEAFDGNAQSCMASLYSESGENITDPYCKRHCESDSDCGADQCCVHVADSVLEQRVYGEQRGSRICDLAEYNSQCGGSLSGGSSSAGDACSDCLSSCRGLSSCCTGTGCICQDDCAVTSCNPPAELCCGVGGCICTSNCPY